MRKGELARFLLTPYYGFRELGCPPRVPPNVPGWHNLKTFLIKDTFFFLTCSTTVLSLCQLCISYVQH